MKFTSNTAAILPYSPLYPFIHIERCGRTCYNSLDKMGKGTALPFVQSLMNSKHYAMLEHANFVFEVSEPVFSRLQDLNLTMPLETENERMSWGAKHLSFTRVLVATGAIRFLVSGNVRSINNVRCEELTECLRERFPELVYRDPYPSGLHDDSTLMVDDLFALPELHEEEIRAHCYITFCCDTDRGVTHEMVRHRPASFAQESTRYCNYSKEKYGGELTFVLPSTWDSWDVQSQNFFRQVVQNSEVMYNVLTSPAHGLVAQQARAILPNALKATIIMTTNVDEYIHFFNLRYKGVTGAPHPDMKDLAGKMFEEYRAFFNMKGNRQFSTIML